MTEKKQPRIAVVTDSTAYLPQELVDEYGIHVIPVYLVMGGKSWRDGVDIDPPAFYELLQASKDFPTTSQPTLGDCLELFGRLSKEYDGIVAVFVSDELSGTLDSARAAAAEMPDLTIEIIDSRGVSMNLGFPALAAARAAAAGGDLETIANAARALIGKTSFYFVVDTLEYLHRGGRIGAASKWLGSILNLKPILEIREGRIQPVAKVRTRRKAQAKVYELIEEQLAGRGKVHMAVVDAAAPEEADRFRAELEARFKPVEMVQTVCSPAIGAHAGPGMVGVAFYAE